MLTPTHLFGVHINSRAPTPIEGLHELFSKEAIPRRHIDDEYFAMDFRLTPDAVHVISSGIDPEGWTPVPKDTAAMVDLATLELTRLAEGQRRRVPAAQLDWNGGSHIPFHLPVFGGEFRYGGTTVLHQVGGGSCD